MNTPAGQYSFAPSACFCVGGPGCCINKPKPTYPTYEPYWQAIKCPDCLAWWRGTVHYCSTIARNGTVPVPSGDNWTFTT